MSDQEKFVGMLCVVLLIVCSIWIWALDRSASRADDDLQALEDRAATLERGQSEIAGRLDLLEQTPTPAPVPAPVACPPTTNLYVTDQDLLWCLRYSPIHLSNCLAMLGH